ncbi:MAG: glycoside hydrolase family 15 protein [Alphaproteobacteria bacterium]
MSRRAAWSRGVAHDEANRERGTMRFTPADDKAWPPIGDYAAIGDGRSVALISRQGSVDWLCLPHFSAPPLFAALLDRHRGGRFALRPASPFQVERRYAEDSNVLEMDFTTPTGRVRITECLTLLPDEKHYDVLRPQAELLRLVHGCEGEVELEALCEPRPDFGRSRGRFECRGNLGWAYCCGDQVMFLQGEMPLERRGGGTVGGRAVIRAGETICLSLAYTRRDIAVIPALGRPAVERVDQTRDWWQGWARSRSVSGRYRKAVMRSALVLKLLHYTLSGAVVAAPTTSLPEAIGHERNWDYRYCWLRDAGLTFEAFLDIGCLAEADFFIGWLLHATRLSRPRLGVMYDIFGETHLPEDEIGNFEGYKSSRPVRTGNGAHDQLQLDVYGSVIQASYTYVQSGGRLDREEARALAGFGRQVCKLWREPDEGIWEKRGGRDHHTYSTMMCWVALDRLLKLAKEGHLRVPETRFAAERDAIEEAVEARGFNTALNSYVATLDGDAPDASLILAARSGYRPANHPRMRGTWDFIARELDSGGMLYRYPPGSDGFAGREGAFGIASFWAVEYLALAGRVPEARARFETLLEKCNDVGLYAEEIDPESGAALGNFPQAFTHIGLITAAMALHRAEEGKLPAPGEAV